MRTTHLGVALGLLNPAVLAQAVTKVTVRVPTCTTGAFPGPSGSGAGAGSGSGSPTLGQTVDSPYGTYDLDGCSDAGPSGSILDGARTTSPSMTLEYCASFCKGSAYFAVQNGDECTCGSSAPAGPPADIGTYGCSTQCTGNASECGGSPRYGIVYHCPTCSSGSGYSTSVVQYTTTDSSGHAYVTSSTSTFPLSGPSTTVVQYTTTDASGHSYVTSSTSTFPPGPSTTIIQYTTTDASGHSYVTSSTSTFGVPGPSTTIVQYTTTDASGHSYVTSSTSTLPPGPSTTIIQYTTTDASGRSYVTSSTSTFGVLRPSTTIVQYTTTDSSGHSYVTSSTSTFGVPGPSTTIVQYTTTDASGHSYVTSSTSTFGASGPLTTSIVQYTTTDASGNLYVTSSTSTFGASGPLTTSIVQYTTTDASGNPYVTSSTSNFPVSGPLTTSIVQYTTTDASGHSYVTSSTSTFPISGPSTSIVQYTTTNASGHSYVTSSTLTFPGSGRSVTVIPITTTDASGSTYTTSTTSTLPTSGPSTSIVQYTTTDASGHSYVTSSTLTFPGSGRSITVIPITTTDSSGSTYTTSTTSTFPISSPSSTVVQYTTTDSGGSSFVTSTTSAAPVGGSSVIAGTTTSTLVTTEPHGSPVTSVQTQTFSSTVATTPAPTISPGAACSPGVVSDSSGHQYQVYCGTDFPGNDLTTPHLSSLADCLTACDNYVPDPTVAGGKSCVGVSYGAGNPGGNCYLKYAIKTINSGDGGIDSARLISYTPQNVQSESLGQGTNTQMATSANTATGSSGPVGSTSTGAGAGNAPPLPTSGTCTPGTYTDASGQQYQIYCGTDFPGNDLTTPHVSSLADCLAACDNYVPNANAAGGKPCVGVSYGAGNPGGNCYLKYAITTINSGDGGIDSARLVSYNPQNVQSESLGQGSQTTTPANTAATGSSVSTNPVSASSTSPGAGNGASPLPSSSTSPGAGSAAGGKQTTDGTCGVNNGNTVCGNWPQGSCCSQYGQYQVYCGTDFPGNDLTTPHVNSFSDCLLACDNYTPTASVADGKKCVAASYGAGNVGGNCYLKYAITTINYGDGGIESGRMISYQPQNVQSESLGQDTYSQTATSPPGATSSPLATTTSSAGSSAATPSSPEYPCQAYDGKQYLSSASASYTIQCNTSYYGTDLISPHVDSFQACIAACDNYVPSPQTANDASCVAVTWGDGNPGGNCYLKSSISSTNYNQNGQYSAYKSNSNQLSSGSTSQSSSSTSQPAPVQNTQSSTSSTHAVQNTQSATGTGTGSSAEPTLTNPTCPANNNTRYTDVFGTTFEVKCGRNIDGDNLYAAHADTFGKCIEYCDILSGCAAVTYLDGAQTTQSNCYPYSTFRFYDDQAGADGVYSGVPVNGGTTTGANSNQQLCTQDDGQKITDAFGNSYTIGCNKTITGNDLLSTVAHTLDGCLTYCSTYNTCVAVTFTGYPVGSNQANCYPKSQIGTVSASQGIQYAALS
ncbi:MAG: hypothetical protein Q9191_004439 [Dirinaria sp. TL-2023a]